MRLREIYAVCTAEYSSWCEPLFVEGKNPNGATFFRLSNPVPVRDKLNTLKKIRCLEDTIKRIEDTSVSFSIKGVDVCWDSVGKSKFVSLYTTLKAKIGTICSLYESFDIEDNHEGIDIKLPPNLTLEELSKCTHDLNIVISGCPLLNKQSGSISLSSIDVGSMWLDFVIIGTAVSSILGMFAVLVDKAVFIKSHYLTMKQQEEQYRSMENANELLENMQNMHKQMGELILEQASRDLAKEHNIDNPEEYGRLKNSLDLLSDWMSKGMEVYASVQSQPDIKVLFPPVEQQKLPTKKMSLLPDSKTETEENRE